MVLVCTVLGSIRAMSAWSYLGSTCNARTMTARYTCRHAQIYKRVYCIYSFYRYLYQCQRSVTLRLLLSCGVSPSACLPACWSACLRLKDRVISRPAAVAAIDDNSDSAARPL